MGIRILVWKRLKTIEIRTFRHLYTVVQKYVDVFMESVAYITYIFYLYY